MMKRTLLAAAAFIAFPASALADTIDFGQFGPNFSNLPNVLNGFTGDSVAITITGPGQGFSRLDEENGWNGHFPDGTPLIYDNGASGAGTIVFATPIASLTNLSMQANLAGAYTTLAEVYLGATLLGTTGYSSVNNLDVPPPIPTFDFSAFASFDRLVLSTTNDSVGWALGGVQGAIPEPATWAMMIAGFGFVGGAMRYRRRRLAVSFA